MTKLSSLTRVFAGRTLTLLVLSCRGSFFIHSKLFETGFHKSNTFWYRTILFCIVRSRQTCIMPTSLAPSPIASVIALHDLFTNSTNSAFCRGDTLKYIPYMLYFGILYLNMSRLMTKPTNWHVRPAKTQIRLFWVFAGRTCHFVGFVTRRLICCFPYGAKCFIIVRMNLWHYQCLCIIC